MTGDLTPIVRPGRASLRWPVPGLDHPDSEHRIALHQDMASASAAVESAISWLPRIPGRLRKIDGFALEEHFCLEDIDQCYYLWEYGARQGYDFSGANQLIFNLKTKPGVAAATPARKRHKQQAIIHAASALRRLIAREFVDSQATFVPIPGSKARADTDYDDRLSRLLARAFRGWNADIREMLILRRSVAADHETQERLRAEELRAVTRIVNPTGMRPRPVIVVVDDVLNSGKHFKLAQSLLRARYPNTEIRALFLARCVRRRVAWVRKTNSLGLPDAHAARGSGMEARTSR